MAKICYTPKNFGAAAMTHTFYIDPEVFQRIVVLAETAPLFEENDLMRDTVAHLHRAVAEARNGWVVLHGEPTHQERRRWTPEEESLFIGKVKVLQNWGGWDQQGASGQKNRIWREMAEEFGRTPISLKSKYDQLRRKGRLEDGRTE